MTAKRALAPKTAVGESAPTATVGELTPTVAVGELARLVWGGVLLAAPGRVLRSVGGHPGLTPPAVLRVLGVRHLAQAVVLLRRPTPAAFRLGAVADGLHALTALALAVDRRRRRIASIDAALAAGWTVHDCLAVGRTGARGMR
ncbi:hypothetical protein [Salinispora arenicola]|uniref:Uncharacterized protein n=2 Tax=Salinispora arenicola TaxID=168697 RepID=A0A542XH46_SALAC|nr:hypothetical protein [Salinispora arenicola]MCN0152741.1 hypothetical protein [Salinispora arenicola]TQL35144.1 hypothetical protein FB564_0167 [Salinispora arenicola]GIM83288.1 hypothetical protein Sar04_11470 [Salinispora arenicola]